ncbi:MAG: LytTR family DNA-binding domain-containing protein [Bacteroidales bacterium]
MNQIKVIIIEDEPLARMKLAAFVERIPELVLEATFSDGKSALDYLGDAGERLIFLDIQMERFSGLQFLEALVNRPKIIITTAYEQYALKGFEYQVSDYLLKPYAFERFQQGVRKVLREIELERLQSRNEQAYILVKAEYKMEKLPLQDILFIEGMKDYLRFHLETHKVMTLSSFTSMEQQLPSDQFLRIHKSYMVSLSKITSLEKDAVIVGGHRIPIGKSYRDQFLQQLNKK